MNSKYKSPLRYPGGKSRVADMLLSKFPTFSEYREPFVGGGSVFIDTAQQYKPTKLWINDLYYDLYCFWHTLQTNPSELIRIVNVWKSTYPQGKDLHSFLLSSLFYFNEVERGAAFFILNRITFSGTSLSGGYSQQAFEHRFTESSINRLKQIYHILSNVNITNLDYSDVISEKGENVFIFMDPPYYTARKSALYGRNGQLHKGFDHERFAKEVKQCRHKWLITYDDCEYIRRLYQDYKITPFNLMYGMRNVSKESTMKGNEIIITNYE